MGERFAQFEIERPLGVGGMAETAQAIRRGVDGFEQRVCLKRILPAFGKDREFVRAFQNEAKLAVRLVHPHICRIYDFGSHEGTWWMSMELVEAGDLRALFDRVEKLGQPLPIDLVLLLAVDIASALHHAHSFRIDGRPAEIVHRDISPSNVLIDSAGHFKLADFGIAKATLSGEGGTRTGMVKGKVPYMAPEHARGEKIDGRADLWSFGVVLYEALAGRRPFRGAHDVELLLNVAQGTYEPISSAAPHTPPVLQRVVTGLLEASIDKRVARAADVLELLAQTPPPANARLRLSELSASVGEERHKSEDRALGEARTAYSERGGTAFSVAEPTRMAPDGVALAPAAQPVSAPSDARTRTAMASVPSMETQELELKPQATEREISVPTAIREAFAIDEAIRASERPGPMAPPAASSDPGALGSYDGHPSGPTPFIVEGPSATATVPTTRDSAGARLAQIITASAIVGLVGVALSAWGLGVFDGAGRDAEPAAGPALLATPAALGSPPAALPVGAAPVTSSPVVTPPSPGPSVVPTRLATPPVPTELGAPPAGVVRAPPGPELEIVPTTPSDAVAIVPPAPRPAVAPAPLGALAPATAPSDGPTPPSSSVDDGDRDARPMGTLVIGVVGFGSVWVDGRRVAASTDHLVRRVRAGHHTVAAGIDAPHETREVDVVAGESLDVLLHAR